MDREDDLYPAFMIARRLHVSRQLVYTWTKAGKLQPAGYGVDGRALYSYADAVKVELQARLNDPANQRSPYGRPRSSVA